MEHPQSSEKAVHGCALCQTRLSCLNLAEFCSNCKHHVCTKCKRFHDKCSACAQDRVEELKAIVRDLKRQTQAEDTYIEALQKKLKAKHTKKKVVDQTLLDTCQRDLQSWVVAVQNKNKEIKELNCIVQSKSDIGKLMENLIAQKNRKLEEKKYRKSKHSFASDTTKDLRDSVAQKTCKCLIF